MIRREVLIGSTVIAGGFFAWAYYRYTIYRRVALSVTATPLDLMTFMQFLPLVFKFRVKNGYPFFQSDDEISTEGPPEGYFSV